MITKKLFKRVSGALAVGTAYALVCSVSPAYAGGEGVDVLEALNKLQAQVAAQGRTIAAQNAKIARLSIGSSASSAISADDGGLADALIESIEEHEENSHTSKLKVGGWLDVLYQDRDTNGYNQIFDPHHLYLFFDAQMDDQWRVYSELEIEHLADVKGGSGEGEIKVERMYIEYNHSDTLNARVGKFNTQIGLWTPEHWAVSVDSVQKPIHEDNAYVPVKQVGVEGFGTWASSSNSEWAPVVNYTGWISTGEDLFGTNHPTDDKVAFGADINASFGETVKLGLTGYTQSNPGKGDRREDNIAPYIEVLLPQNVTLSGQYLSQERSGTTEDIDVWYGAAKWQFKPNAYLYYRRDQGDDDKRGAGDVQKTDVFTLGYWPKPYVRTKLEYSSHNFDDPSKDDYNQWNAWIGVIF